MKSKAVCGFVFALLFALNFAGQAVFAFDLDELIPSELSRALLAGGKPALAQFKNPGPLLLPNNEALRGLVDKLQRDLNPSVMVETLNIYEKPAIARKEAWSPGEEVRLFNNAMALSTLAGLQYFSASRGQMRTFYETSFVIDGLSAKKRVPDPLYPRPPAQLTLFASQKDLTFGDNVYQYDYYSFPGVIFFVQQNLTSLTYGIIPAVGKSKLYSTVAILDAGDYLLVYMASMAKAASLPGMKERLGNSFANRAEAIFNWFSDQADKAFDQAN